MNTVEYPMRNKVAFCENQLRAALRILIRGALALYASEQHCLQNSQLCGELHTADIRFCIDRPNRTILNATDFTLVPLVTHYSFQ
jgi:hypothetical protein